MIVGTPGNEIPCAFELKLRFAHEPESDRFGNSPERAWRTRAAAASDRKPAIETDAGTTCEVPPPVAWRTASANDKRSGAGACALDESAKISAKPSAMSGLLADAMEIEVDVSVEVTADVEAFGHARRERPARDDGVHHGRHGELRRDRHVHAAELAGFDTPLQYSGHQAMTAGDDFLVVEAGELGKIVRFRHHQLRDADERRFADETPVLADETLEQFARAAGERLGQLLALGEHRNDRLPDQRLEQRLFVLEVEIDGAFGDTGSTRDVLELRGGKTPIGEDLQRGADDLFRTGIFPAVVQDEVGTRRRGAQLAQERHDLAAVVGRMVDEVAKHLAETVEVFPAAGRLYDLRVVESRLRHPGHKPAPVRLDFFPPAPDVGERRQILPLRHQRIGLAQPAVQPQLLGPDDVTQGTVNPAVAALQVAEVLIVREPGDRVEDRAVRPGVVIEQLEEFVHALSGRGELSGIHHAILHLAALDHLLVANHGPFDLGVLHLDALAEDAVGDRAPHDAATRLDGYVGTDRRVLERDAVFDVDGLLDLHVCRDLAGGGPLAAAVLQQVLVRFEQRIHLAAVVPAGDFADEEFLPVVHHVLERVREIELAAFTGRTLQDVFDTVEQRAPILHVLQSDVGPFGNRRIGLLHYLCHVALLVGHDDAEALVVLHFFGPDDAVGLRRFHDRQIGVEQCVHEDDDDRSIYVWTGKIHRARRPVEHLLLDEARGNVVVLPNVGFDLFLQMSGNDDQLIELPGVA